MAGPDGAGPMPLRRLTKREYNNTVRDLLGDTSAPADSFPPDRDGDFLFQRAGLVATVDATRLAGAAQSIASQAKLEELLPCQPASPADEAGCARMFVEKFGLRAYRRPLAGEEVDRLMAVYDQGRGAVGLDFADGVRLVIEAMLQSPNFIYRWELGPDSQKQMEGQVFKLGPYEMASRLSYGLWGSMPDDGLFEAAAAGKLGTEAEIDAQARRMLADSRARDTMVAFFEEWLGFGELADRPKDPEKYPEWKDDLKAAMSQELDAFVRNVVFEGDGKLSTLLSATYSWVSQPLAAVYGLEGAGGMSATAPTRAELDPQERSGLFTLAGFMALTGASDGSHPVNRGKLIYERALCGILPPPPPEVPEPKPPAEGLTTRERFAEHGENACAKACHELIDPLGFAFENYDGIGRFRTMDSGKPVDASGTITLDGAAKSFQNARELSAHLASSAQAQACFVTQMTRFALQRQETEGDKASLEAAVASFQQGGASLTDLVVAIAKSRSFRYRSPAEGEAQP